MSLGDIFQKLYKKNPPDDLLAERKAPTTFRPEKEIPDQPAIDLPSDEYNWESSHSSKIALIPKRGRLFRLAAVVIVAGAIIYAVIALFLGFRSFSQDNLAVSIESSPAIASGEEISYRVTVLNRNRTALKDLNLQFYYPTGAVPSGPGDVSELGGRLVKKISFPDLLSSERRIFEFPAVVYGAGNAEEKAEVRLAYRPSGINARYERSAEFVSRIVSSSFALHWDIPSEAVSGQTVSYTLTYVSNSDSVLRGGLLEIVYPSGFDFLSASPAPSKNNNIWEIADLPGGEEGKIRIEGILRGSKSEVKMFLSRLGVNHPRQEKILALVEETNPVVISSAVLAISQIVNQQSSYIASAGESLNYLIEYSNDSDLGIRGATIVVKLEGEALDLSRLSARGGSFSSGSGLITWTAAGRPELALLEPGEKGEVSFTVPVKKNLPVNKFSDKNFVVASIASIDSPNIPSVLEGIKIKGEHNLSVKIKSQLLLGAKGFYYNAPIANSGPLPPRVGQETTYAIIWELRNTSNDTSDAEVSAYLPPQARFTGRLYPENAPVTYDQNTGQVVWKVGTLAAGAGEILPVRQIAFQVGITPAVNQVGDAVELVGESVARAKDLFTGVSLEGVAGIIDISMKDDPAVRSDQGKVAQ